MPSEATVRRFLRAALCAAALAAAACRNEQVREAELSYEGRTTSQWYDAMMQDGVGEANLEALASGGEKAVPMFLDVAEHHPDATGVGMPTEAPRLGKESLPALRQALEGGSLGRRAAAALSLAQFGDDALDAAPKIAELMVEAAESKAHGPLGGAREALRLLGPGADSALASAANAEEARKAALETMGTHSWLALPAMESLLHAKDEELAADAGSELALVRSHRFPLDEWSARARAEGDRQRLPHDRRAIDVLDLEDDDRQELHLEQRTAGEALELLLGLAANPPDGRTRRRAMTVLKEYGREAAPAVPHSLEMYSSSDSFDRVAAAGLAAAVGPEAKLAIPGLVAMFDENLERTRLFAAWALGRLGPESTSAFDRMQALWEDGSGGFLTQEDRLARHYLGAMGMANIDPARAAGILAPALDDVRWSRRLSALEALVVVGTPATEVLERTLEGGSPRARAAAALALHHLGEEDISAWVALSRLAGDPDPAVRMMAEQARKATAGLDGAF